MKSASFKAMLIAMVGAFVVLLPAYAQVDPNSRTIVPDHYQSITLEKTGPNYIRSGGTIKILFSRSATISFTIEKTNSPNVEFNKNSLPFTAYINEQTVPSNPSNNYVHGKSGDYSYTFTAPEIPGEYEIVFSEPSLTAQAITDIAPKYKITVIGNVNNETLALKVVDRFLFANLTQENNIRDWKVDPREIKPVGNDWDVSVTVRYRSCGIDWESDVCTDKSLNGHYLVNKVHGMVIERE